MEIKPSGNKPHQVRWSFFSRGLEGVFNPYTHARTATTTVEVGCVPCVCGLDTSRLVYPRCTRVSLHNSS